MNKKSESTQRWQRANRDRETPDRVHGTAGGYTNHGCRCDRCRAAWNKNCSERRARRVAAGPPDHVHGTQNGYGNYGCRCFQCTTVWSAATSARAKRRKERKLAGDSGTGADQPSATERVQGGESAPEGL